LRPEGRGLESRLGGLFSIYLILPYNETVHQLFVDFKKANDSVRKEVLYNILIEFGIPVKLVSLIKMCLNETYGKVCSLQPPACAGSSLANFSTLKMKAIRSSESSVHTRSTPRHIPEDAILHSHRCENLKSYNLYSPFFNIKALLTYSLS
jgi:hypothetical protein